jgi:hypothetical protein
MTKTYHGSCHCGAVKFEVDADISKGTGKCNCTLCTKSRFWAVGIKPTDFRLLTPADAMTNYNKGPNNIDNSFCKTCGVYIYHKGSLAEMGGDFMFVSVPCLNAGIEAMIGAPVNYANGLDDKWWEAPEETRYL